MSLQQIDSSNLIRAPNHLTMSQRSNSQLEASYTQMINSVTKTEQNFNNIMKIRLDRMTLSNGKGTIKDKVMKIKDVLSKSKKGNFIDSLCQTNSILLTEGDKQNDSTKYKTSLYGVPFFESQGQIMRMVKPTMATSDSIAAIANKIESSYPFKAQNSLQIA